MKNLTKWQVEIEVRLATQRRELNRLRGGLESAALDITLSKMAEARLTQRIDALVASSRACAVKPEPLIDSDFVLESIHSTSRGTGYCVESDLKQIIDIGQVDADIARGPLSIHVLGGVAYRLGNIRKVHITMTEVPE